MEARRLERQRRDSAKSSAAETLPSTQDEEFHLRLIELYCQHPCLWKTSLSEYEDAELKRQAWQDISNQLGAHLTPSFVRSRISSMRYRLNVYKLQMLEFKMSPASGKQPEKLYYIDKFAFLDEASSSQQQQELQQLSEAEQAHDRTDLGARNSDLSISSIFKQRMQRQQQQAEQLPQVLQRLSQSGRSEGAEDMSPGNLDDFADFSIASVVKKRMQQSLQPQIRSIPKVPDSLLNARRLIKKAQNKQPVGDHVHGATGKPNQNAKAQNMDIDSMLKQRMHRLGLAEQGRDSVGSLDSFADLRGSLVNIPSVVKKRMRQQLPIGVPRNMELEKFTPKSFLQKPESMLTIPPNSATLRAQPGDSVSTTKVSKQPGQPKPSDSEDQMSDEEEFYRLHWSVRQQQRSRRPPGMVSNRDLIPQPVPPLLLGMRSTTNMESANDTKT
ncbi:uncharacterized protein LOC115766339 [Drosophila novamexicana]|uniref:uncharacterized protein LOC115766339 n=1 Tax=Drosophila novamexicana TaxID=47314 RepID=UPI0011E5B9C4|nr:uncharacterized protein LOC115766339 [Drosophila novamexicana]